MVYHNLSGYDSHFLINDVANGFEGKINLIALNKEKYISFTKHVENKSVSFKFIDSMRFMNSSLEKLASYMKDVPIVKKGFSNIHPDNLSLLRRKGVYPYEYVSGPEKLTETQLSPKDAFFSSLTDCGISDEDYSHAQNVWSALKCQTLMDYTLVYMKLDVLLLADIFEEFREKSIEAYGLDPAHYFTAPGLSWDSMLKFTKIELELLEDIDMVLFIEKGIRGGKI